MLNDTLLLGCKMTTLYQCIICHQENTSTLNLHNHHIQHHSPEELSQTIISLRGLTVRNDAKESGEKKCIKIVKKEDNNNNSNQSIAKQVAEVQNDNKCTSKGISNLVSIHDEENHNFGHDKKTCVTSCSEYIAWECELNKRKEVNDEEFLDVIDQLCYDLSKRKRRGRKRKNETSTSSAETKCSVHIRERVQDENAVVADEKITNKSNDVPPRLTVEISLPRNIKSLTNNTTSNDNIINMETKKPETELVKLKAKSESVKTKIKTKTKIEPEPEPVKKTEPESIKMNSEPELIKIEDDDSMSFPLYDIDTDKNVLIYDPLTGKFSWSSIMFGVCYEKDRAVLADAS